MDHSAKTKVLKQLARTGGEIADKAMEKEAAKIAAELDIETRYDLLEQQIELLDIFAFRVPETAVGIVRQFFALIGDLELTHDPELVQLGAELTKYQSKNRLIVEVLKLLDRIRYHRLEDILEIFMSHSKHEDESVSTQADEGLEHLAEYNIDIFYAGENQAGLGSAPQLKIIELLEALDTAELQQNSSAIVELCSQMLSPTMTSSNWDYKSVTWSTCSIPTSEEIQDIRQRSMQLLKYLYEIVATTAKKMSVINAMQDATRTPNMSKYGDDVLDMVSENTLEVLAFCKNLLADENLQIVQKIEHDAFWRFRHASRNDVKTAALEIRDLLAENDEYTIYKALIGFEGVFEDWEESLNKEPDFKGIDEYRSARAKECADSINVENWAEWHDRILIFVTTESDDMASFPHFFEFLRLFAEKSPNLAFGLLTEDLDDIQSFTIPLLRGLWNGPRKEDLRKLMLGWIATDKQLVATTKLFISNDNIDEEILLALLGKGIKDANGDILNWIITVVVSNYVDDRKDLISKFFLPAVKSLTSFGDVGWINDFWFRQESKNILHSLSEEEWEIILGGLLVAGDVDHRMEELLNRDSPDDIQNRENCTTVSPPRERHPFRSHPMA